MLGGNGKRRTHTEASEWAGVKPLTGQRNVDDTGAGGYDVAAITNENGVLVKELVKFGGKAEMVDGTLVQLFPRFLFSLFFGFHSLNFLQPIIKTQPL